MVGLQDPPQRAEHKNSRARGHDRRWDQARHGAHDVPGQREAMAQHIGAAYPPGLATPMQRLECDCHRAHNDKHARHDRGGQHGIEPGSKNRQSRERKNQQSSLAVLGAHIAGRLVCAHSVEGGAMVVARVRAAVVIVVERVALSAISVPPRVGVGMRAPCGGRG